MRSTTSTYAERRGGSAEPLDDQPWGLRDFRLVDPDDDRPPVVGRTPALLAAVFPMALYLGAPPVRGVDNGFVVSSTSSVLALTIILALVGPVLNLLHGRGRRRTWVLLGLLLLLSTGSKPSILPVVGAVRR